MIPTSLKSFHNMGVCIYNTKKYNKSKRSLFIIFVALITIFLFQNCLYLNHNSSKNSKTTQPYPDPLYGNGGIYDGKLQKLDFYIDVESTSTQIIGIQPNSHLKLDHELPKGLFFNPERLVIYGKPLEVTNGYLKYQLLNSINEEQISILIGVGKVFTVNSKIEDNEGDFDLNDNLCLTSKGVCSIRAAVEQANYRTIKSRIVLPEGHYKLGNYPLRFLNRADLWGAGKDKTILDGEGKTQVINALTDEFEIKDLKIINGFINYKASLEDIKKNNWEENPNYNGACVSLSDKNAFEEENDSLRDFVSYRLIRVEVSHCLLKTSTQGGAALFVSGQQLYIDSSHFHHNSIITDFLYGGGGAINVDRTYLKTKIINSVFENNESNKNAGAIYFGSLFGTFESTSNQFISNVTTYGSGGALFFYNSGSAAINNSLFENNRAQGPSLSFGRGGAVQWQAKDYSNLNINNSIFKSNISESKGSAINYQCLLNPYITGNIQISQSQFISNQSMSGEGALYTFSLCTMALGTSTFTSNGGGTCAFEDKGMSEGVELRGYFLDYGENKIDDNSCIFK